MIDEVFFQNIWPWQGPEKVIEKAIKNNTVLRSAFDTAVAGSGEAYGHDAELKDWLGLYRREQLLSSAAAPFAVT